MALLAVLLLIGITALPGRGVEPRWLADGTALFGVGAVLAAGAMLAGPSAVFPLPPGGLGGPAALASDRLGALFLLLLFVSVLFRPSLLPGSDTRRSRLGFVLVGLVMVCGDGMLLAIVVPLAAVVLGRMGRWTPSVPGLVSLLGLMTLLLGTASGIDGPIYGTGFGALRDRAASPGVVTAGAALALLTVAIIGTTVGTRRRGDEPGSAVERCQSTVGAMLLCQYLLLRVGFDLCASILGRTAVGTIILLLGAALMAFVCARALHEDDLRRGVVLLAWAPTGLTVAALGTASMAHGIDFPAPQAAAVAVALLAAATQVLAGGSLLLLCESVVAEQGATTLRHLGGAARSMPRASMLAGLGACCVMLLPPFPGYAAGWMLAHAILATARFAATWWVMAGAMVGILIGAFGGLLAVLAWMRLAALVALDRPRTPRAAAAIDIGPGAVRGHLIVLTLTLLLGMAPGFLARRPPVPNVSGVDGIGTVMVLSAGGGAGYGAMVLSLLLVVSVGVVRACWSRFGGGIRLVASWNGGMKADPPWLPFGDPMLQPGPRTLPAVIEAELGFVGKARRATMYRAGRVADRRRRMVRRTRRMAAAAVMVARERRAFSVAIVAATILVGWWLGS